MKKQRKNITDKEREKKNYWKRDEHNLLKKKEREREKPIETQEKTKWNRRENQVKQKKKLGEKGKKKLVKKN